MAFPESFLQELTERNEISEVVSSYVRLNKRSGANLFGLCPFHSEKTPSFSVSTEKQIYHCFGCGKGGGVINFIMEIENLSYPDAVRFLAKRVGMTVPEDNADGNDHRRERMLLLNRDAARYFHAQLRANSGKIAQDYVLNRGISPEMAVKFGLGFAPNTWNSLCDAMRSKGYTKPELLAAGLARASKKGDGNIYDTFRNRLMFPVIDIRGNVIGFSGRILDDGEPKYMNSPETLVFNKSRNLFAMNLAKKSKKGYIILSEGNIDVVSLHQAGFDCAVASLGTSLTAEQARLIKRYTDQVVIAYDGDGAGQKASKRAIEILQQLELKVKVLRLTGAKDPDEYIKKFGAAAFENLLTRSESSVEYRLTDVAAKYDMETDEGRISFLKESAGLIAKLPGPVEREVYAMKVAEQAKVSSDAVISEVNRTRKKQLSAARKKHEGESMRPMRTAQPKNKELRFNNVKSAMAEQGIIRLLYYEPSLFTDDLELSEDDFSEPLLGRFYEVLREKSKSGEAPSLAAISQYFNNDEMSLLTGIIQKPQELSNGEKALDDYIKVVKIQQLAQGQKSQVNEENLAEIAKRLRESKGYGGKENE